MGRSHGCLHGLVEPRTTEQEITLSRLCQSVRCCARNTGLTGKLRQNILPRQLSTLDALLKPLQCFRRDLPALEQLREHVSPRHLSALGNLRSRTRGLRERAIGVQRSTRAHHLRNLLSRSETRRQITPTLDSSLQSPQRTTGCLGGLIEKGLKEVRNLHPGLALAAAFAD